ncbi:MAG: ornithine cyclodeaminase [Rhodocyclales bacterium]|nr:ornithine cyclodeaminase [Rhodocyclales bacterium]
MQSARKTSRSSSLDTLFLSASDITHILACKGLGACLAGMADYIRDDFLRWPDFEKSARTASHSAQGVIELMPVADAHSYSFKYVNGHPGNYRFGLPTVMAFGVLADVATGVPRLVSELTLTTALRTAATSALAARALARPASRSMALIGNGAQSEFQALAFHHLLGIESLRLFDIDTAATAKLMRNLRGQGMEIAACNSATEAVRGADIVTTITADKTRATILTPEMIAAGVHINAVGGDCPGKTELHADILRAASVFVEYEPQTRGEGEIQQMPLSFPVTELWQVLNGSAAGRRYAEEITVFDSVGFALEDYAALRFMRNAAEELGVGQPLDLIPALADPKNLFALLDPATTTAQLKGVRAA